MIARHKACTIYDNTVFDFEIGIKRGNAIRENIKIFRDNMNSASKLKTKIKSIVKLSTGGYIAYQFIYLKKDFDGYYENVLQPLGRLMNPEIAHRFAILATKYGFYPASKYIDPPNLASKVANFNLSSPIGIAAGFDKDGEAILGLRNLGFSLVEIGSITPEPQSGNPKPRVFRLPEDHAVINRYGFNSQGHEAVLQRIKKGKNDFDCVLGINLGKNKMSDHPIQDYIMGIEKFGDVADYFVINVSSPNTPGLRKMQKKENLKELLTEVKKARDNLPHNMRPPLFVKIAPDLTREEKVDIANVLKDKQCKVDGIIISNTTVDKTNLKSTSHVNEAGGLSGKPLRKKSTELIKEFYKMTKGSIPIIGVGGVFTGEDAYEKILAGASAVQIYTAFIYHGPPVINKIKAELADLLARDGYKNVSEAVGRGV